MLKGMPNALFKVTVTGGLKAGSKLGLFSGARTVVSVVMLLPTANCDIAKLIAVVVLMSGEWTWNRKIGDEVINQSGSGNKQCDERDFPLPTYLHGWVKLRTQQTIREATTVPVTSGKRRLCN